MISKSDKIILESLFLKYGKRELLKVINESNQNQVIINKGPNEKTWNLDGYVIELSSDKDKYIVLLKSKCKNISYEIHIENESGSIITQDEKDILFKSLYNFLKSGDVITSFGGCTPGGLTALENLVKKYGFTKVGTYSGEKIYWSSPRLVNGDKFNEWIKKPEHKHMFNVKDKSKPLTMDNTTPVISVIKK